MVHKSPTHRFVSCPILGTANFHARRLRKGPSVSILPTGHKTIPPTRDPPNLRPIAFRVQALASCETATCCILRSVHACAPSRAKRNCTAENACRNGICDIGTIRSDSPCLLIQASMDRRNPRTSCVRPCHCPSSRKSYYWQDPLGWMLRNYRSDHNNTEIDFGTIPKILSNSSVVPMVDTAIIPPPKVGRWLSDRTLFATIAKWIFCLVVRLAETTTIVAHTNARDRKILHVCCHSRGLWIYYFSRHPVLDHWDRRPNIPSVPSTIVPVSTIRATLGVSPRPWRHQLGWWFLAW
mmetsp:Transcript_8436/g.16296  ORF Transcript_8436/g.16296 Transcript_8436/m.16296 type:complete len:295 (+) Transcript_8436:452-1336(+)